MPLQGEKEAWKQRMLAQPVIRKKLIVPKQEPVLPTLYANTGKPISRLLFEVISLLKEQTEPISNAEVFRKTMIDIEGTPGLCS